MKIQTIKDYQLNGGVCSTEIWPVTSTAAVLCRDSEGNAIEGVADTLEERLASIETRLSKIETLLESMMYAVITTDEIENLTQD